MKSPNEIKSIIEALLIVSEKGVTREELRNAIEGSDLNGIEEGVNLLRDEYSQPSRSFNIAEIAGRFRIVTKPEYMPWISNLYAKDLDRLTGPSLETLAIIAYKQPVTRVEIEMVRGVNVGGVIKTLVDRDMIRVRGRKEVIGRPLIYGTTEKFLEIFGLKSLDDLPLLREFTEEDLEYGKTDPNMIVNNRGESGAQDEGISPENTQEAKTNEEERAGEEDVPNEESAYSDEPEQAEIKEAGQNGPEKLE